MAGHASHGVSVEHPSRTRTSLAPWLGPALVLLASALMSGVLLLAPIDYRALGDYGYPAVFLITLVATGTLLAPVPYLALIAVAGSFLEPALVALVAGLAAALGELTGYFLGRSGRALLPSNRWAALLERGIARFGLLVVFVGGVVPNPFFDAIGLLAGALHLSVGRFLVASFFGKALRFWLIATLGVVALPA